MTKRSKRKQTCHNKSVKNRAAGFKGNGYNVKADLLGYKKPKTYNGSRPDIVATKGKKTILVEAETKDTRFKDLEQQRNLRRYANSHKNTQFRLRTC